MRTSTVVIGEPSVRPKEQYPRLVALLATLALTLSACGGAPPAHQPEPDPEPEPDPTGPVARFAIVASTAPGDNALTAYAVGPDGRWVVTDSTWVTATTVGVVTHPSLQVAYVVSGPPGGSAALRLYTVGADGRWAQPAASDVTLPPNPRPPRLHPDGRSLYVPSGDGTIWQYAIADDGTLAPLEPPWVGADSATSIQGFALHPSGTFAYATLPFASRIAAFSVGSAGALEPLDPPSLELDSATVPYRIAVAEAGIALVTSPGEDAVLRLTIAADGQLTLVGATPTAVGCAPLDVALDAASSSAYVSCNAASAVQGFALAADGTLAPHPGGPIPAGLWPEDLTPDPSGTTLHVTHGSQTGVRHLAIGADGRLSLARPWPSATRGAARAPAFILADERARVEAAFVFLSTSDTTALRGFDLGTDPPTQTPNVLVGRTGVAVHPSGRWLYAATGTSLLSFHIAVDGALFQTLPPGYSTGDPSYTTLTIDRSGRFLFAAEPISTRVAVFRVLLDGTLAFAQHVDLSGAVPTAVAVHPSGRFVYVAVENAAVHQFALTLAGSLEPLTPASVPTAGASNAIAVHPDGRTVHAGGASAVSRFTVAPDGRLTTMVPSTVAVPAPPTSLVADPLGRTLHAAFGDASPIATSTLAADGGAVVFSEAAPATTAVRSAPHPAGERLYLVSGALGTLAGVDVDADGRPVAAAAFEVPAGGSTAHLAVVPRWR
jgi:6-phosphogluconolactonase